MNPGFVYFVRFSFPLSAVFTIDSNTAGRYNYACRVVSHL